MCISLMAKNVEHVIKCLSTVLDSCVGNSLLRSCTPIFPGLFVLLVTNFLSSLYTLENSPLINMGLVKIFSHSRDCHFVLLTVSFAL